VGECEYGYFEPSLRENISQTVINMRSRKSLIGCRLVELRFLC